MFFFVLFLIRHGIPLSLRIAFMISPSSSFTETPAESRPKKVNPKCIAP